MGKTYRRNSSPDEYGNGNVGKNRNHANGKKTGGMRTLNNYIEEEYDFDDDDPFDDEIEISDDIQIRHTKHIK
jgi:hypothetical protein